MDLLVGRRLFHHLAEERHEVGTGVASRRLTVDLARPDIQRRVQRQGSVAVILEAVGS
jgi:hypothetical protein